MSMRIMIVGLVVAAVLPLQAFAEDPARVEQLGKLFEELRASGAKQLSSGEGADTELEAKVNKLVYDEQSVTDLVSAIKSKQSDPATIYATRVLLQPLLRTKPEVMKNSITQVDRIRRKAGKYRYFKSLSEKELKKYKFPDFDSNMSAEEKLKRMNDVQKMRDIKLKGEAPVQMNNLELRRILDIQIALAMAADDSSEDRKLMGLFTELEKGGLLECFAIIANIQAQANSMKPERARAFREQCLKLGNDMKADRKEYVSPSTMSVRADANSTILKQVDYPGIKLLTCANEINKALGEEEIKVPTTVEVDQYIAERDKKKGKR